jgi:transcriptional regulator with XRE-family HTH domain
VTPAQRFAANLRRLREAAGYSQETLAYLAGLNRTQVGRYETGEALPKATAVIKLAGALSAAPGDLLAGIEWEPNLYSPGRMVVREDDA